MFIRLYRRARADNRLLRGQVLVGQGQTIVNLSVWPSRQSMLDWAGHPDHVKLVRWTYKRSVEVWSAVCHIDDLSQSGHSWNGELSFLLPDPSVNSRRRTPFHVGERGEKFEERGKPSAPEPTGEGTASMVGFLMGL
jgi:hypothetical protein